MATNVKLWSRVILIVDNSSTYYQYRFLIIAENLYIVLSWKVEKSLLIFWARYMGRKSYIRQIVIMIIITGVLWEELFFCFSIKYGSSVTYLRNIVTSCYIQMMQIYFCIFFILVSYVFRTNRECYYCIFIRSCYQSSIQYFSTRRQWLLSNHYVIY